MPSLTPTAPSARSFAPRRRLKWLLLIVVLLGLLLLWWYRFGTPDDFDNMEDQFKYGSIGADHPLAQAPLPYWLWKVLPEVIPPAEVLPEAHRTGLHADRSGYEVFGLVVEGKPAAPRGYAQGEPQFLRPVGFSRRNVLGMDFVGLNCAFCHTTTYKATPGGERQIVAGGAGNAVDIESYFLYMFGAMSGEALDSNRVMAAVDRELARQNAELGAFQRLLYRYVILPLLPHYLPRLEKDKFDFIALGNEARLPDFGPGRVDTWGLYKRVFVKPAQHDNISGTSDFPPLWNQKARVGMRMHWDGNTDVLIERNVVSALSLIGPRIEYLDFERLTRVTDWIMDLLPPRYEDRFPADTQRRPAVDRVLAQRGASLFASHCGRCHAPNGDRVGRVEPIADLGTDRHRIQEFTPELARALNRLGTRQWKLRHFRVGEGYVNTLLDGAWLRAPYLHNGSVPTMRDLLTAPDKRPKQFCRGSEDYDWKNLGFVSATVRRNGSETCASGFRYDTTVPGNGNLGHAYGTELPDGDRDALIEFMKTL
jgi:hypothetical protein